MNKQDLLLEIGLEEIPARFILQSEQQLQEKLEGWLIEQKIEYGKMQTFSTPRRLAILIKDVVEKQPDEWIEAKGPAKKVAINEAGEWTKAAIGFSKSQQVDVEDIYFKEIKGTDYAHAKKFHKGKQTISLLSSLGEIVKSLHFPNNMRWGNHTVRYIRPIRWLVALYGTSVIPFEMTGISSGRKTSGHRFLGENIELDKASDYEQVLKEQFVIASYEKRKEIILQQINELSSSQNWIVDLDDELLEEVTNLVEFPTVFFGSFESEYLGLPDEVLITSMKTHQRYFSVKDSDGNLVPYFIAIRNGNRENLEQVQRGNEKVLRARLADAEFFFDEDQKITIEESLNKLQSIIYHEKLGTLAEKVARIKELASFISNQLDVSEQEKVQVNQASTICKFDLVSNMVDEFPELQGIMGEKYALQQGEDPAVAQAVREHYLPLHADGQVPVSTIGAIISMADKLDTIVSTLSIGLIPTGSQDPYALRRQAAGIIKILLEKNWKISLANLFKYAVNMTQTNGKSTTKDELYSQLESFFVLRIHHLLASKAIRHDIIEAVLKGKNRIVTEIIETAELLQKAKEQPNFKSVIESLARVQNIALKAKENENIKAELFENNSERELFNKYNDVRNVIENNPSVDMKYESLATLQPAISNYFDHTMVMAEDEELQVNRLAQMKKLADLVSEFAAVNEINVK